MKIRALRDPEATFEDKAAYLNYLWSVKNPALISTEYPVFIYGPILIGTDRYTQRSTFRLVRLLAGSPFGPTRKDWTVGLA